MIYIDDILLMAEMREVVHEQGSALVFLLQCLGFTMNPEKTILQPTQTIKFLGLHVNTLSMEKGESELRYLPLPVGGQQERISLVGHGTGRP